MSSGFSGSDSKEYAGNVGDLGSTPGSERFPGEGNDYPLQYYCLENPRDRGAWWATVQSVTESDTTEQLSKHACKCFLLPSFFDFSAFSPSHGAQSSGPPLPKNGTCYGHGHSSDLRAYNEGYVEEQGEAVHPQPHLLSRPEKPNRGSASLV